MKKIFEYLDYVNACFSAVTKGVRCVIDNWPAYNPFDSVGQNQNER